MKNSQGYGSNASSKWSRQHDCCINCQYTDRKHAGKGLCSHCYKHQYSVENADRVQALKQASYEQIWFGGNHETVLQRDNYKCTCCGSPEKLVVHHLDGNGRGSENPNNDLGNLQTLCRSCHARVHQTLEEWSRNHDKCINCGTTQVRHAAKGLCINCYSTGERRKLNPNPKVLYPGEWSFNHDCCQSCQTTSIKHQGNGLCLNCYRRCYRRESHLRKKDKN